MKSLFDVFCGVLAICGTLTMLVPAPEVSGQNQTKQSSPIAGGARPSEQLAGSTGEPAISFEENRGQFDPRVRFVARGNGQTVFLTADEAAFVFPMPGPSNESLITRERPEDTRDARETPELFALKMRFAGANAGAGFEATGEIDGKRNYFKGSDESTWVTDVPSYRQVSASEIYRGVDIKWYENEKGELEYDLVLAPGADAGQIRFEFDGADKISVNESGDLVIETPAGSLHHQKPVVYQERDGAKLAVEGSYDISGNSVGFVLGDYDRSQTLVIDPIPSPPLTFSTYLGGSAFDGPKDIKVDLANNVYVTGYTTSVDYPIDAGTMPGNQDAFVTKLNATATATVYSTVIGGSLFDRAYSMAVDGSGNVYVAGATNSTDFPVSIFAYDRTLNGYEDAFMIKLSAAGNSILRSTYIGGSDQDNAFGLAIDSEGAAYITGETSSSNFPTTTGAYDRVLSGAHDAFVTKLNSSGLSLGYSTYLGGTGVSERGSAIAVDSLGRAHVTGQADGNFPVTPGSFSTVHDTAFVDCFVTKLNNTGSGLVYSAKFGGDQADSAFGLTIDSSGNAYITGYTTSSNYPTTFAAYDPSPDSGFAALVTKLNAFGSNLLYSTYLEGTGGTTWGYDLVLDSSNYVLVTGKTSSSDFPTHLAYDKTLNGANDVFLTKLTASAFSPLRASTLVGGSAIDEGECVAINSFGDAFVAARTQSLNFPTTYGVVGPTYRGGDSDVAVFRYHNYWLP